MSFFSDLFHKKPGGTFFGNLIRTAGGVAGNIIAPGVGGNIFSSIDPVPVDQGSPYQLAPPTNPLYAQGLKAAADRARQQAMNAGAGGTVSNPNTIFYLLGGGLLLFLLLGKKH